MTDSQIKRFLEISIGLSAERDREKLLSSILDAAMEITNCDAGTLYLYEKDGLHFTRMVTKSMNVRQGGHGDPISLPPVPLEEKYVASWALIHNSIINVSDVRTDSRFDFSGSARYDEMTGYNTKTMLVVPLTNDKGELIGVAQLINALDEEGKVIPFSEDVELITMAAASQAAIAITNMKYSEQITQLLDSLVGAMSTAIDQRTPYNANHTRNMVKYGEKFLDWLTENRSEYGFDVDKRRAFLLSVWLHDVGKMVVPLEVMDKESRLGSGLERIKYRFRIIALLQPEEKEQIKSDYQFIESINKAGFLPDDKLARVEEIAAKTFTDEEGLLQNYLTEDEKTLLSIRKGTLSAEERKIMESHVVMTSKILDQVSFPTQYAQVPIWAGQHHELLNGKGYPSHKSGDEISDEVRLLTILDVFDALTARDRPYKPPMPVEKALAILHSMVEEGSLDEYILGLFEESKAWEE